MIRVLFICMGNICRSPAADGVFRRLVAQKGYEEKIHIDSAGTLHLHAGDPPDERMRRAANRRQIELVGAARGIEREDFSRFDWLITMDDANYATVLKIAPSEKARSKVKKFTDWVELEGIHEVPDPYYGGSVGFDHVLDILEHGSAPLLRWIIEENGISETGS